MSAFDFFDKIVCINLDSRPDRWAAVSEQFAAAGIGGRVERFSAIAHSRGSIGCLFSHQACIKAAKAAALKNILIFEDDVIFTRPLHFLEAALNSLQEAPDWELFYLGARPVAKVDAAGPHLIKSRFLDTHSLAVRQAAFDRVLDRPQDHIDAWYSENLISYAVCPFVTAQAASYSDVLRSYSRGSKDYYDRELRRFSTNSPLLRALYDLRHRAGVLFNRCAAGRVLHAVKDRVRRNR